MSWQESLHDAIRSALLVGVLPDAFLREVETEWQNARRDQQEMDRYYFEHARKEQ